MRHIVTHVFFLLSAFVFYLLIYLLYKNRFLAILGYLILLLSPPIYAHSFFNTKDIPCMCMFIICFFMCELALKKWKTSYFLLFGICTGLLINIRVLGIMFILFATLFIFIDWKISSFKKPVKRIYITYIISTIITLIVSWPYLWKSPVGNFVYAVHTFAKFPWVGSVLLLGENVKSTDIPWFYIPFWFSVTTPIPIIFAGLTGCVFLIVNIIKKPLKFLTESFGRNQLIYFCCFWGSILLIIILHSVVYDGWRHMYFIYPAFILLIIYGISCFLKIRNKYFRLFTSVSTIAILLLTVIKMGSYMYSTHPHQNIYFNDLVSQDEQYLRKNLELDYWGTSYKQALEYVLNSDKSKKININIAAYQYPGKFNALILKKDDRERLNYVDKIEDAGYFISNYRGHPGDYNFPASSKVFNIKILNSDIISVWKVNQKSL